jgi:hypothetical protein
MLANRVRASHLTRYRHLPLMTVLLALGLLAGLGRGVCAAVLFPPTTHIYSVRQLYHALQAEPAVWLQRTVVVRAVPVICTPCGDWLPGLVDPEPHPQAQFFPLVPGGPARWPAFLRRLPLLDRLAPSPQVLVWDRPAVYRVQLRRITCLQASRQVCVAAVLLDAAFGT